MVTGPLTGPVTIENTGDREPDRSGNRPRRGKIATFTVYTQNFLFIKKVIIFFLDL